MRIVVMEDYQRAVERLDAFRLLEGHEVVVHSTRPTTVAERAAQIGDAEALVLIRERTPVDAALLALLPDLRLICQTGRGMPHIDVDECTRRGIVVCSGSGSAHAPAELTLALILASTRCIVADTVALRAGTWQTTIGRELHGRTLGIVGYGNIGSQLSVLAEALGMSVVFYDTAEKLALGNARSCESLDELLEIADVVTLHVDGRDGNAGMFEEDQFARMRTGAVFLNLSRGFVVDHRALAAHIASGHLSGAAIDVFPEEPSSQGDAFRSDLRGLPNVILTPHIGGSTEEAQQDIGRFVAAKLRDFVASGSTTLSVNLPQVAFDQQPGTHRLAHLHTNTPGVLAAVNGVLADHQVNIEGQALTTRGQIGYLLTDIACDYEPDVVHALAAMPVTTRLRVLS